MEVRSGHQQQLPGPPQPQPPFQNFKQLLAQLSAAYDAVEAEKKALVLDNQRLQRLFWQKPGERGGNLRHAAGSLFDGKEKQQQQQQQQQEEEGQKQLGMAQAESESDMSTGISFMSSRPTVRGRQAGRPQPKVPLEEIGSSGADSDSESEEGEVEEGEEDGDGGRIVNGELQGTWLFCDVDGESAESRSFGLALQEDADVALGSMEADLNNSAFSAASAPEPDNSAQTHPGGSQIIKAMVGAFPNLRRWRTRGANDSASFTSSARGAMKATVSGDFGTWKDNMEGLDGSLPGSARGTWQIMDTHSNSCEELADPTVIHPISRRSIVWPTCVLCCLIFEMWTIPLQTLFVDRSNAVTDLSLFLLLGVICDIVFISDTCLNCTMSLMHRPFGGEARISPALFPGYLRWWLPLDLFASYPGHTMAWVIEMGNWGGEGASELSIGLLYLRFLRMPRLWLAWVRHRWYSPFAAPHTVSHLIDVAIIFAMWAHVHGCVWAWLSEEHGQKAWKGEYNLTNTFDEYIAAVWWACRAMTSSPPQLPSEHHWCTSLRLLEIAVGIQRAVAMACCFRWLLLHTLIVDNEAVVRKRVEVDIQRLLIRHKINREVQCEVLWHVHQALTARANEERLCRLLDQGIPKEVLGRFCSVAWSQHLQSLNLFVRIGQWHSKFIEAMSLRVLEQIVPEGAVLFRRGDMATGAHCVVQGLVGLQMQVRTYLPFTPGMWVGEKALVIGTRKRATNCRALQHSILMFVAAQALREVLTEMGLYESFEQLCADEVWRGLCGRCGSLGDHFTRNCPFDVGLGMRRRSSRSSRNSKMKSIKKVLTNASLMSCSSERSAGGSVPSQGRMQGSLLAYLREVGLQRLEAGLTEMNVTNFDDLLFLDLAAFKSYLAAADEPLQPHEEELLSPEAINAHREKLRAFTKKMLATTASDHHLIFLSHAKAEAGVDCVLLRTELEAIIGQSPPALARRLSRPIFLDIEDLSNMKELRTHVKKSYNFFFVLTPCVLTRPWCLAELTFAVEFGVRIILVELMKKGVSFVMPDEDYYRQLRNGEILGESGLNTLRDCGLGLQQVEDAVREVFMQIALPYSPQRSAAIRKQELSAMVDRCRGMR